MTMTNNPTIDGVSLLPCPFCAKPAKMDAEGVRGDDAWCFIRCSVRCKVAPYVGDSACVWYWSEGKRYRHQSDEKAIEQAKDRAVSAWNKRPDLAALQSTIAQLEDKLNKAIDLDFQRRETIARLEARVQELESGMGEIIHQVRTHGSDCWEDISGESLELCRCDPEEYEIRKLFTAPPAPVAVVPDGWKLVPVDLTYRMLEAGKDERMDCFTNPSLSVQGALIRIYSAIIEAAPSCLDATAALNGPAE